MRALLLLLLITAVSACDRQADVAVEQRETAIAEKMDAEQAAAEEQAGTRLVPPSSVTVNESALDAAAVLNSRTGPEGTQLEVVRAEANSERMVIQLRVVNPTDRAARFKLNPRAVLARSKDLTLMAPAVGGAADSSTDLSREELLIALEPGQSEIVSLAFFPPESDVHQIEIHLPGMDPITDLPLSWEHQQTAEQADEEEAEESTTG